jgi:CxxC-x17-CxxC domain-containing protein
LGIAIINKEALMALADKTLICAECGKSFVFTTGEQEFYQAKGLQNDPKRCPECRSNRKQTRSGNSGKARQMYKATCAKCGIECEVPFEPRQERPVYCSNCYAEIKPAH